MQKIIYITSILFFIVTVNSFAEGTVKNTKETEKERIETKNTEQDSELDTQQPADEQLEPQVQETFIKAEETEETDENGVQSFNFLYHLLQYKFTDIIAY